MTVFDALLSALRQAADYNRDDTVSPVAVLWPDEKREWEKLVPRLRAALPQFLIFGPYDASHHSGPAIWLRCVLAGKIAGVTRLPANIVGAIDIHEDHTHVDVISEHAEAVTSKLAGIRVKNQSLKVAVVSPDAK